MRQYSPKLRSQETLRLGLEMRQEGDEYMQSYPPPRGPSRPVRTKNTLEKESVRNA
ncbi:hypothetical protein PGT21_006839 [Puccinia graminis f. sp. tritici]|uniref:Uncharacterized protein n=1 Tax=Puccinia graminis f. sp. tritici TaxID=56615 RepID=A0A5B0LKV3_PUCGR|nr:hypothetical protein PGTUg99_000742 [Puccinia graminis f. sp. tritici]KAA1065648.1 hypothetical protein PGT21_006131 [Puccinia graminis f. sp. tritici]KAA1080065.1 hypothetical protein PGTUg99_025899 [Puccinia graminis f. sp. tritici]KAA1097064.1 hypothetical protein PGTUg99_004817 [Puccinia graminis f. sp. tritici]KAA1103115.1 hypothetical protein PGT21_006839 [Puccinia graminis f. sp. tritici]